MAATTTQLTPHTHSSKPKRRKRRETTISTSATDHPTTWCCSSASTPPPQIPNSPIQSKSIVVVSNNSTPTTPSAHSAQSAHSAHSTHSTQFLDQDPNPVFIITNNSTPTTPSTHSAQSAHSTHSAHSTQFLDQDPNPSFCLSPHSPVMDSYNSPSWLSSTSTTLGVGVASSPGSYPTSHSYSKFNSALNAGLLNPLSPPQTRSSPTLFEMMANEADGNSRAQIPNAGFVGNGKPLVQDRQLLLHQRLAEMLGNCSPGSNFNDPASSDVKLTLSSKDGLSVSMNVHRQVLVGSSRFFAEKLSDKWSRQQRSLPHVVEISDCDDVEVYVETLRLMYCRNLRRRLMKEDVSKVLGILKVSAAIMFEAGVLSCLEYLEAVPWAEDEEEKVSVLLSQLHLPGNGAGEVLKRVSAEIMTEPEEGSNNEEVLIKLLQVVLEGKDEKARRNMKSLVLKMLRESSSQNDLSKESLCSACDQCLQLLRTHFLRAAETPSDQNDAQQIARQADNLHWLLDIMIDRQVADDFLKTWAEQSELSEVHHKVPPIHRYEVSRVTARLFVGIGKGQLLASKETRCLLLQTWLKPFYDDFSWMRRASNGLDRHSIEDGLSNTILTLPLAWQQDILLAWFDRFLNSGEDCPNIQRGFQVWWRRAFWRRYGESEQRPL